jgi:uncharacterized protein (AIM24 family)
VKLKIERGPSALASLELSPGEGLYAAPGALLSAQGPLSVSPVESARQLLQAESAPVALCLAPALPGDIAALTLSDDAAFFVQRGAYLASSPEITLSEPGGVLRKGPFWEARGAGILLCAGFGTLESLAIEESAHLALEHLVAFSASLSPRLLRLGGAWAELFSPEIVCALSGAGVALLQARRPKSFGESLTQRLRGVLR